MGVGSTWCTQIYQGGGGRTVIPDVDFLNTSSTATSSSTAASTSIPSATAALSGSLSCWRSITSSIPSHSSSEQGAFLDLSFWIWFCFTYGRWPGQREFWKGERKGGGGVHESPVQGSCLGGGGKISQVRAKGALPSVAKILTSSVAAPFCARGEMCTRTKPCCPSWRGIRRRPMGADLKTLRSGSSAGSG